VCWAPLVADTPKERSIKVQSHTVETSAREQSPPRTLLTSRMTALESFVASVSRRLLNLGLSQYLPGKRSHVSSFRQNRDFRLKIDFHVAIGPGTANQEVTFSRSLQWLRIVSDNSSNKTGFARMTDARSAGPGHRNIASLRKFEQALKLGAPRSCNATADE